MELWGNIAVLSLGSVICKNDDHLDAGVLVAMRTIAVSASIVECTLTVTCRLNEGGFQIS